MTEAQLNWAEQHAREKGFTDEEYSLALVAEVRRLREALLQYGQHLPGIARCQWLEKDELGCGAKPCTCGLDEALAEGQP